MLRLPYVDERAALQFEDLASALDAGLPVAALGGDAAAGERVLQVLLQRRGVALTPIEDAVFAAGWGSGRASHVLRRAAVRRRQRSDILRTLLARLAYPAVLLAVGMVVALISGHPLILAFVGCCLLGLFVLAVLMQRGLRSGTGPWLRWPLLGAWLRDGAELPYLEVLHGLYAAGEPILQAHPSAVASCPIAAIRARLRAADQVLQGRVPLAEALLQANAISDETTTLIATGERAGELEDALWRALQRRTEVHARRTRELAVVAGTLVYVFAAGTAIYLIFSFYQGYYGQLRGLMR